jgi:hypothetical protein
MPNQQSSDTRLNGWKEIAAHLGKGVLHRPAVGAGAAVAGSPDADGER